MKAIQSLAGIEGFLLYFVAGVVLLAVFTRVYMFLTPYNEIKDIKAGKVAPSITLIGAMIGYTIPLLSASLFGASFGEYLIWGILAGVVQLACFWVMYRFYPNHIEQGNCAAATLFAGTAVCIGLLNAFSFIPS